MKDLQIFIQYLTVLGVNVDDLAMADILECFKRTKRVVLNVINKTDEEEIQQPQE